MNKKDSLGDRMKSYEEINRSFLIPKLHTILRLDGRAFHTYTKKFKKPYDEILIHAMNETAKYLCANIQGAQFAYVQSDEITIYLSDATDLETQMWYGGNIQKMVSVSAAMATAVFNKAIMLSDVETELDSILVYNTCNKEPKMDVGFCIEQLLKKLKTAEFDSRVFQLPNDHEVVNCVLWRQQDCVRNSVSSVAQYLFSHKELHGKNVAMMKDMIKSKVIMMKTTMNSDVVDWDEMDPALKYGRLIQQVQLTDVKTGSIRNSWSADACPLIMDDKTWLYDKINNSK